MATARAPSGGTWPTPAVATRRRRRRRLRRNLRRSVDAGPEHAPCEGLVARNVAEEGIEIGRGARATAFVQPRDGGEHTDDLRLLCAEVRGGGKSLRVMRAIAAILPVAHGAQPQLFG